MPAPRKYPEELRERSLRLVSQAMAEDASLSLNAAVKGIGPRVGVLPDTLRGWAKQMRVDTGLERGTTTTDTATIKHLQAEVRELKRQRHPAGGVELLRAGTRPATAVVVEFIDTHRDRFGVEPICRVLTEHGVPIASRSYRAFKARPTSTRAARDERVLVEVRRVHTASGRRYGARKVYQQLRRGRVLIDGTPVARCTVERLMKAADLQGLGSRGCRNARGGSPGTSSITTSTPLI